MQRVFQVSPVFMKLKTSRKPLISCSSSSNNNRKLSSSWAAISLSLLGSGFIVGPLIDGLHSRVNLVVYRNGAIDIGPLHTNIWVPPLLGVFYCSVGILQLVLDEKQQQQQQSPESATQKLAASFIALVVMIEASAEMYKGGVDYNIEAYILFGGAQLVWMLLDNTTLGFALSSLVGIACPLAEIPIIKSSNLYLASYITFSLIFLIYTLFRFWHLWYYPKPNVELFGEGLVSWTMVCYFVYTPFLISLSRWIKTVLLAEEEEES